ncbi:LexA family protein [Ruthenibacterium lactatiformans]|uniref:LexA family protein n=1 Tax=Ruthenibacterium lactatiformans TaxID=1550024 RepID=UPI0026711C1E|nr:LexA family transcriptional regulator [Ruthenibacterium lactatiformans]
MAEFHIRLQDALTRSGLSQSELCERTGIPKSAMSQYLSGAFKPKQDRTYLLAQALNVSAAWLMGYDVPSESEIPPGFIPVPKMQRVPVVGRIACGTPITADENLEGYTDAPDGRHVDFALICEGESMVDAGISDGDVVFVRKQPTVENGQIAAVRIDGEATLKRVYINGNTMVLQPANVNYTPLTYTISELDDVAIEGLVVGWTHWV